MSRKFWILFFCCFLLFLILPLYIFIVCTWSDYSGTFYQISQYLQYVNVFHKYSTKKEDLKYVLQWTRFNNPFRGQDDFIKHNCSKQNCFVTNDRSYFRDVSDFDAIYFWGTDIHLSYWIRPFRRSQKQLYIFVSSESSHYYPICRNTYNNFFNRTMTYKLDSDIQYQYIIITNKKGEIVGPKKEMQWIDIKNMLPINKNVKDRLAYKKKAAVWLVSNCKAISNREAIARNLKNSLKKYGLQLDIYGECGDMTCDKDRNEECLVMIERDYYFYLAFENSFSEDYVTEKILAGLQHYSVPIVYGGANYSRFMPNGIYLDVNVLGVQELAKQMHELINDKEKYYEYFKWHNHYSYLSSSEVTKMSICDLCATLNNDTIVGEHKTYSDFISWWSTPGQCISNFWYTMSKIFPRYIKVNYQN